MRNLLMLSVAVCIGCTPVFVKPADVSDQQFAQDTYRCQLEAGHEAPQPPRNRLRDWMTRPAPNPL